MNVMLMDGESRGTIRLSSTDADASPIIEQHYLEDPADQRRLREGVRLAAALVAAPQLGDAGVGRSEPLIAADGTDDELDHYVRRFLGTAQHLSSSCRMGATHDERSVVDSECRVFGVSGLRVADTGVMPKVGRRGPAATAMMIGAHAAAMMR